MVGTFPYFIWCLRASATSAPAVLLNEREVIIVQKQECNRYGTIWSIFLLKEVNPS